LVALENKKNVVMIASVFLLFIRFIGAQNDCIICISPNTPVSSLEHLVIIQRDTTATGKTSVNDRDGDSTQYIYIGDSASVFGREHIYVKPRVGAIAPKTPKPVSPYSIRYNGMVAVVSQTQRNSSQKSKGNNMSACLFNPLAEESRDKSGIIPLLTTQKQRLSPAAIQCGVLTSLGANSPPYP
jgi:hypothetical protein